MTSSITKFLGHLLSWGTCLGLSFPVLAQEIKPTNIAMWKVQSPQNTVYLLGSVHIGKNCTLESPRIEKALAEAEHAVFEIDYDTITPEKQIQFGLDVANLGRLRPNDRTLKESVDADTYDALSQKLETLKPANFPVSLDQLNAIYHPAFITFQIQGFKAIAQGLSGECGVDKILTNKAKSANKTIIALETFEQQQALIKKILESTRNFDLNTQIQQVLNDNQTNLVTGLVSSVLDGKIEEIETQVIESCKPTPQICYQALDERNLAWINTIKTYLQTEDDYFITVGVAHMIGPNSLITLLEQANYTVEPF